jgi:hypothetical protein
VGGDAFYEAALASCCARGSFYRDVKDITSRGGGAESAPEPSGSRNTVSVVMDTDQPTTRADPNRSCCRRKFGPR